MSIHLSQHAHAAAKKILDAQGGIATPSGMGQFEMAQVIQEAIDAQMKSGIYVVGLSQSGGCWLSNSNFYYGQSGYNAAQAEVEKDKTSNGGKILTRLFRLFPGK